MFYQLIRDEEVHHAYVLHTELSDFKSPLETHEGNAILNFRIQALEEHMPTLYVNQYVKGGKISFVVEMLYDIDSDATTKEKAFFNNIVDARKQIKRTISRYLEIYHFDDTFYSLDHVYGGVVAESKQNIFAVKQAFAKDGFITVRPKNNKTFNYKSIGGGINEISLAKPIKMYASEVVRIYDKDGRVWVEGNYDPNLHMGE